MPTNLVFLVKFVGCTPMTFPLLRARVADWILLVVELAVQVFFMYFCYFNLARCGFRVLDYGSGLGIFVKISVIIQT